MVTTLVCNKTGNIDKLQQIIGLKSNCGGNFDICTGINTEEGILGLAGYLSRFGFRSLGIGFGSRRMDRMWGLGLGMVFLGLVGTRRSGAAKTEAAGWFRILGSNLGRVSMILVGTGLE